MDFQIYGLSHQLLISTVFLFFFLTGATVALHDNININPSAKHSSSSVAAIAQINSNFVLAALLDPHYIELSELVEKALLLQTLEDVVSKDNITIFIPKNEALERDLDPEFKRFLLEPSNLKSLQNLLLFHTIPTRIDFTKWPKKVDKSFHHYSSLRKDVAAEILKISHNNGKKHISVAKIIKDIMLKISSIKLSSTSTRKICRGCPNQQG